MSQIPELTIAVMLAPLSVSCPNKQFFKARPAYYDAVKAELGRRDPSRVEALLQGL